MNVRVATLERTPIDDRARVALDDRPPRHAATDVLHQRHVTTTPRLDAMRARAILRNALRAIAHPRARPVVSTTAAPELLVRRVATTPHQPVRGHVRRVTPTATSASTVIGARPAPRSLVNADRACHRAVAIPVREEAATSVPVVTVLVAVSVGPAN